MLTFSPNLLSGWPNHLLIPKGSTTGVVFELFCMISNYEDDEVQQELTGQCNKAASYCGVRDGFYPDHRAMGFPFDRMARREASDLATFLTSNMNVQDVKIVFNGRVMQRSHKSSRKP
jgi:tyrosinase